MPALPSIVTQKSISLSHARNRGLQLYREWLRAAPEICDLYKLEVTPAQVRRRIKQEFQTNRYVRDINLVDLLLFKGRIELEETMNLWKQPTHIMRFFPADAHAQPKKDFLSKFYDGL